MNDILDEMERLGIFADINPADPAAVRQVVTKMITDGELIFRHNESGAIMGKFFNESVHFFVKPGIHHYDAERGLYRTTE
jgi:hypothetical protein